jgi:phage terminase large subunit
LQIQFPKILNFLFKRSRYKVAYGGRGSAKSWGFARALLLLGTKSQLRVVCAREYQTSIRESVHKLLSQQIEDLGLQDFYTIQQHLIYGPNGTEFIFAGLHNNVSNIKSLEGADIVWVEEAETVSEHSWYTLIPTVRKPGSEIWVTFNPRLRSDPTSLRYIVNPPPDFVPDEVTGEPVLYAQIYKVNWRDNPWFPIELRRDMEQMKASDYDKYRHVYEGDFAEVSEAQILKGKCVSKAFSPSPDWHGPYLGVDWGFSVDPTTLIKCWTSKDVRTLYIEYEAYGVHVELDNTPELFDEVPGARDYVIRADNARPESISYLQRHGYGRMIACKKGPGSVEDGIAFIRSFEMIVIHPRCVHTEEESRLYTFKTDRLTGDILPDVVDANNHCMDALRYALEPISRKGQTGLLNYYAELKAEMEAEAENKRR